jgi:hypothetical protein
VGKTAPVDKRDTSGGVLGALLGVVALLGAAVVLGGGSGSQRNVEKASNVPNELASVTETDAKAGKNATNPPVSAPSVGAEKTQALIVKVEKRTESSKPVPAQDGRKLPPTTANSPAVLIGGSLVALVAAAAVGGGDTPGGGNADSTSSMTSASEEVDAVARAKEAREWIANWRAKQK